MRLFLQRVVFFGATVVVLNACAGAGPQPAPPTPSDRLGIEMDIKPVDGKPGQFTAKATVIDLDTDAVVGSPSLNFSTTQAATIETGVEGRWLLHIGVSADAAAKVATYEARFTRDGKLVSRQRVSVNLNG
jgi:hypothetical protein